MDNQKRAIVENYGTVYAKAESVPNELIRTPLQRAIQILKRHRDIYFKDEPDNKPISMIITTLAARFYDGESDVFTTLDKLIQKISDFSYYVNPTISYSENVEEVFAMINDWESYSPVIDKPIYKLNGKWYVPNPVNPAENFADRWDTGKANAFFSWLKALTQSFGVVLEQRGLPEISKKLDHMFGSKVVKNAFIKEAERTRRQIDIGVIKTSSKTGILSNKGTIRNKQHNFFG